jgi:single-strand DNA-binding protein
MAKGVNKVILVGHLGRDPEFKVTPSGTSLCTFSLATTDKYKNRDGQTVDSTEWHNIEIWGKLGEIANQYLKKGSLVYLEGRIKTDTYEKDGATRYFVKIVVNEMNMLGGRDSAMGGGAYPNDFQAAASKAPAQQSARPSYDNIQMSADEMDEVPF